MSVDVPSDIEPAGESETVVGREESLRAKANT